MRCSLPEPNLMNRSSRVFQKLSLVWLVLALCATSWVSFPRQARAETTGDSAVSLFESQSQDIIGIEYLFAAPNGGAVYSRFGHALLRLVNPKQSAEKNLVISIGAAVDENNINYVKGLIGGYKLALGLMTLEQAAIQYNLGTNQNIDRYIVALRSSDLKSFLNHLDLWLKNPSEMGDYTFLSNNCAGALSRLFKDAGIDVDHTSMPGQLSVELNRDGLSPFPPLRMSSAALTWMPVESALGITQKEWEETRSLSTEQIQKILKDAGPVALARVLYRNLNLNRDTQARLRAALSPYFDQIDFDDLIDIRSVPAILYQASESAVDFDAINQARREVFGKAGLKADLDYLAATSFESEISGYGDLEIRRIKADKSFAGVEIARGLEGLTSSSELQLAYEDGELRLIYLAKDSAHLSSPAWEHSVKIAGQISQDGKSVRFGTLVCSLSPSAGGLGDDCGLISTRSGLRRSVSIVGFQKD